MADPTLTYVDPSIAANSGAGTIGDPYGDVQFALDTMTRDGTNGDRLNIKAGTSEILAAALDLSTYGTPTSGAPLIIQGYTSAAEDGGIGAFDFNGGTFAILAAVEFVHYLDLKFHNAAPTTYTVIVRTAQSIRGCHFTDITGDALSVFLNHVVGCRFDDISGVGVSLNVSTDGSNVAYCDFRNGTKKFTTAILGNTTGPFYITGNTISIDGSSKGISGGFYGAVDGNSVLSSSGTGTGIEQTGTHTGLRMLNNLVEGFSGAGGKGFDLSSGPQLIFRNNAAFNNTINYSGLGADYDSDDNEVLSVSPFDKSGDDTFANRFTYFSPVDTGNVHGGAYVG